MWNIKWLAGYISYWDIVLIFNIQPHFVFMFRYGGCSIFIVAYSLKFEFHKKIQQIPIYYFNVKEGDLIVKFKKIISFILKSLFIYNSSFKMEQSWY